MRDSNNKNILANKAAVSITATLYDRRALDCTDDKPLVNSLNHLIFLSSSSGKVREALSNDGGLERLIDMLYECTNPKTDQEKCTLSWKWVLALQCLVLIGTRGTERIRKKLVDAGIIPVIATILDNYLYAKDLGSGVEYGAHMNTNPISLQIQEKVHNNIETILRIKEIQSRLINKPVISRQNFDNHLYPHNNNSPNHTIHSNNTGATTATTATTNTTTTNTTNTSATTSFNNINTNGLNYDLLQSLGTMNDSSNNLSSQQIDQELGNIRRSVIYASNELSNAQSLINQDLSTNNNNLNNITPITRTSTQLSNDIDQNIVERTHTNNSTSIPSNATMINVDTEAGTINNDLQRLESQKLALKSKNEDLMKHRNCFDDEKVNHQDNNLEILKKKLLFLHFVNRLNNLNDLSSANFELLHHYNELIESCCSKNQLMYNQDISNILLENMDNGGDILPFLSKVNLENTTSLPNSLDSSASAPGLINPTDIDCLHQAQRSFENGILVPQEDDVVWCLQTLAFLSKYTYLRHCLSDTHIVCGLSLRYNSYFNTAANILSSYPLPSKNDTDDMMVDDNGFPELFNNNNNNNNNSNNALFSNYDHALTQQQAQQSQVMRGFNQTYPRQRDNTRRALTRYEDDETSDDGIDEPLEYYSSLFQSQKGLLQGALIDAPYKPAVNLSFFDKYPQSHYDFMFNEFNNITQSNSRIDKAVALQKLHLRVARNLKNEHSLLRIKNKKNYEFKRKDYELKWDYETFDDFEMEPETETNSCYSDLDLFPVKQLNIFPLVEQFTVKNIFSKDFIYWSQVIVRNSSRKDETRGGRKQCANFYCGKWEDEPRQFAKCRKCKRAKYCSKDCQSLAWVFHRHWCNGTPSNSTTTASSSNQLSTTSEDMISHTHNHQHHHHHHHNHNHQPTHESSPLQQQQQIPMAQAQGNPIAAAAATNLMANNAAAAFGTAPQQFNASRLQQQQLQQAQPPLQAMALPLTATTTALDRERLQASNQSFFETSSVFSADTQSIMSDETVTTNATGVTAPTSVMSTTNQVNQISYSPFASVPSANATVPPLPNPSTTVSGPVLGTANNALNNSNFFRERLAYGFNGATGLGLESPSPPRRPFGASTQTNGDRDEEMSL